MKKISVIIPVYNVEKYLTRCLDSLVKQTVKDFEVIIINDGSTDNSQKIIDKYAKYGFKSHFQENSGQAAARNFGIEASTGEYILFLDGDDYYEENTIETLLKQIEDNTDILQFNMFVTKGNVDYKEAYSFVCEDNIDNVKKYIVNSPSPCDKLFKKSLFLDNNIKFPINKFYEDLGTIPSLGMYTKNIKFINNYLYHYVKRTNSTMNKIKYDKRVEDIFEIIKGLEDRFIKEKKDEIYKDEIEFIYIHHLLRAAGIRFLNYKKYDMIDKIRNIMKEKYPNFTKNQYFKMYGIKQKIMCRLLYSGHYKLIELLRK